MARWAVHPEQEPSTRVQALAEPVERDGGRALAPYRDPVGGPWQIFRPLPMAKVEPTASQRDLSPTGIKRLQEGVRKLVENLEAFELSRVRYEDIQRAGLMASPAPAGAPRSRGSTVSAKLRFYEIPFKGAVAAPPDRRAVTPPAVPPEQSKPSRCPKRLQAVRTPCA